MPAMARPRCWRTSRNELRTRSIWFRLDHTDGDWVTFLNYITAAIQTVAPDFGRATYSLFTQVAVAKPSLEAAVDAFMVDIGTLAG